MISSPASTTLALILGLFLIAIVGIGCGAESVESVEDENPVLTAEQNQLVATLEEVSFPINAQPLEIHDQELAILDELSQTRIVGLGEATHGTREFFEMKFRIFQYLVEHHGYKAFLFEMDFAEAMIFNDWVQGERDDDIETLMFEKMIFWTWRTLEVKELLEWMRSYNHSKSEEEKIGIYGVDVQFADYNVDHLVSILHDAEIEKADSVVQLNVKLKNIISNYTDFYSDQLREDIRRGIDYATEVVDSHKDLIRERLGRDAYLWARQLTVHMDQVESVIYDQSQLQRYHLRDLYMADNTSWFFELLGEDAQLVLWAHNAHVADDFDFAGFSGGSQGSYLKQVYGSDYQIIGFSFAKGQFTAVQQNGPLRTHTINDPPLHNSANFLLYQVSYDQYIVPTKTGDGRLDWWFEFPKPFLQIGSTFNGEPSGFYRESNLNMLYDYLIHFDHTTNSRLIRN